MDATAGWCSMSVRGNREKQALIATAQNGPPEIALNRLLIANATRKIEPTPVNQAALKGSQMRTAILPLAWFDSIASCASRISSN
jgi:hypothetical protein